jgi:hypothetical protein
MPDPTSVCNQAIGELGGGEFSSPRIQSFVDGTSLSTLCGEFYPDTRDAVLALHPWNFSTAFTTLARSPDTPAMKWHYQYPLPTDPYCLHVRGTDQGNGATFEVGTDAYNGRVLYSNASSVSIEYTKRVEDLTSWSPLALQVLIKMLASKLAKPLTGQSSLTQLKWQEALALLPEARGSDGREGSPIILRANTTLTTARRRSGGTLSVGEQLNDEEP